MISKRMLEKWRREALAQLRENSVAELNKTFERTYVGDLCGKILRLTQELIDQHLLRKELSK